MLLWAKCPRGHSPGPHLAAQPQGVRIPSMFPPHFTLEWEERPGREEQKSSQSQRVGGRTGESGLLTPEWAGPVVSVWWLKWGTSWLWVGSRVYALV